MATERELSDFLEGVERRAFKQTLFAVKNEDTALDLVQEAMIRLAEKYGDRPAEELGPLFTRILQNVTLDHHRRSKIRSMWTTLFSAFTKDDEDDHDILETLLSESGARHESAESEMERSQIMDAIEQEIKKLPDRQREAFLLRYWEEMDISETAAAMGCSEGSVKTHCSRATHTLAAALKSRGIEL
jgi:RNA polymerase sigma-70 factor (ECF subfamily)